jgi:APA family basic amino acid/polyamine antiporter
MRIKRPDLRRPFKVPFNIRIKGYQIPITAILGAIASFSVWALVVITKPDGRYLGFSWLILGLAMYFYYRRQKKISPTDQVVLEKIKVPKFHTMKIKNILLPLRSTTQTDAMQIACEMAKLHKAQLTVLHVIEIPFSMPLETALPHRVTMAGMVLKTAEAVATEEGISLDLTLIRARNIAEAIVDVAHRGGHDLLVLEAANTDQREVGTIINEILQKAPCRLWICSSGEKNR